MYVEVAGNQVGKIKGGEGLLRSDRARGSRNRTGVQIENPKAGEVGAEAALGDEEVESPEVLTFWGKKTQD